MLCRAGMTHILFMRPGSQLVAMPEYFFSEPFYNTYVQAGVVVLTHCSELVNCTAWQCGRVHHPESPESGTRAVLLVPDGRGYCHGDLTPFSWNSSGIGRSAYLVGGYAHRYDVATVSDRPSHAIAVSAFDSAFHSPVIHHELASYFT